MQGTSSLDSHVLTATQTTDLRHCAHLPVRPKLLVVDDQALNIQVIYQTFCMDHQVFMATNGHQALHLCQSNPPDLILLDVEMPDMDGFEVLKRLKADPATANIPVIFVTAHDDPAVETHCLDLGAMDYIAKPINPVVVRARVNTHLTLKFQSDLLRELVYMDGLTGVFNRRYFDQQFAVEVARAARNWSPLSVIMLDIDCFKLFNDHYGHQVGDACLRQVAQLIKSCLKRPADCVTRYGGEEFACILPDTPLEQALMLGTRLEECVRDAQIPHAVSTVTDVVTLSVGVGTRTAKSTASALELLQTADAQLYCAKEAGRGRVSGEML